MDIWTYWLCGQFALDKTVDHITDTQCIFKHMTKVHFKVWFNVQSVGLIESIFKHMSQVRFKFWFQCPKCWTN